MAVSKEHLLDDMTFLGNPVLEFRGFTFAAQERPLFPGIV
jgi:hypothetical protein